MTEFKIGNWFGVADRNHAGDISAGNYDDGEVLDDADSLEIAVMRSRLNTISATVYTTIRLQQMTENDMLYAIRMEDLASTV